MDGSDMKSPGGAAVDRMDIMFAALLGLVFLLVKVVQTGFPALQADRTTVDVVISTPLIGYILFRARKEPRKLDEWGLTARLTPSALLVATVMMACAAAMLAVCGAAVAGKVPFEPRYIAQIIGYIPAAFPQQFALCSVGLVTLAKFRPFRGQWRLPLAVGLAFCLAHFWTPARIPGTIIPIQMLITFPAGFFAAYYFARFRSILPLTAIHAVAYPLLNNWIERAL